MAGADKLQPSPKIPFPARLGETAMGTRPRTRASDRAVTKASKPGHGQLAQVHLALLDQKEGVRQQTRASQPATGAREKINESASVVSTPSSSVLLTVSDAIFTRSGPI